ncbi:MAG: hypothetical protein VR70_16260 [Rhodospirillaceae bacterium BRH_c57]|nr:MAG: hypothetical protein VR70_16260 [Rhodospirillaceae bacterium BRH_c57]
MVRAHVLFVQLDDIQHFRSLSRLIDRLASRIEDIPDPSRFELEDDAEETACAGIEDLVALLVARTRRPIVQLGNEGMEQHVAALWHSLWPSMRRTFAFRMSFGPDDIVDNPAPAIVCTPPSLVARWHGYPIVGQASAEVTSAAKILAGETDKRPVADFAARLGYGDITLLSFPRLVQAYDLVAAGPSFDTLAPGMRLVNFLSAAPETGRTFKAELVSLFADLIATATPEQIMSLRNFSLPAFPLQSVWNATAGWMEAHKLSGGSLDDLVPIISTSHAPDEAIAEWRCAIVQGGRALAARKPKEYARAFWTWLTCRPDLLPAILNLTPSRSDLEPALLGEIPEKLEFDSGALRAELAARNWLTLHGATLAVSLPPPDAIRAQLSIDTAPAFVDGLKAALAQAKPSERVAIAAHHDDARLDAIAGAEIAANHRLLHTMDMNAKSTQRLWAAAIENDPKSWQAPVAPQISRNAVLINHFDGGPAFTPLIEALAKTPLADLSDFHRRAELWDRPDAPEAFLGATAKGWLARAGAGNAEPLDPRLARAVLEPQHLDPSLGGDLGAALNIIASLENLSEDRVLQWFNAPPASASSFTHLQAEQLGSIILKRRWLTLLNRVVDRAHAQPALKATVRICAAMLPTYSRWLLNLSPVSADEKWDGLAALAAELYPEGPEQRDLWERSGGKDSDLLRRVTGAEMWRSALRLVRNGSGPSVKRLLAEMRTDYGNNPDLRIIAADQDITSGTRRLWGWGWP